MSKFNVGDRVRLSVMGCGHGTVLEVLSRHPYHQYRVRRDGEGDDSPGLNYRDSELSLVKTAEHTAKSLAEAYHTLRKRVVEIYDELEARGYLAYMDYGQGFKRVTNPASNDHKIKFVKEVITKEEL